MLGQLSGCVSVTQTWDWLTGTQSNMLEIAFLLWERWKQGGNPHLWQPPKYTWNQQVQRSSIMDQAGTEFSGVPAHVALPRCCFGDPWFDKVMEINFLFSFHSVFCGHPWVLYMPAHTETQTGPKQPLSYHSAYYYSWTCLCNGTHPATSLDDIAGRRYISSFSFLKARPPLRACKGN